MEASANQSNRSSSHWTWTRHLQSRNSSSVSTENGGKNDVSETKEAGTELE